MNIFGKPERFGRFPPRRARPVGRHGGGKPGMIAAIALIDIFDHLIAPRMFEIDIDIRRLAPLRRDEAFEEEIRQMGLTSVIPIQKQTVELAADPRPWQRMSRERAKWTRLRTVRK